MRLSSTDLPDTCVNEHLYVGRQTGEIDDRHSHVTTIWNVYKTSKVLLNFLEDSSIFKCDQTDEKLIYKGTFPQRLFVRLLARELEKIRSPKQRKTMKHQAQSFFCASRHINRICVRSIYSLSNLCASRENFTDFSFIEYFGLQNRRVRPNGTVNYYQSRAVKQISTEPFAISSEQVCTRSRQCKISPTYLWWA